MEAVWIATLVMLSAVLIVNLGLGEAIAEISGKILKCPTCLSFWGALAALLYNGTEIVIAVSLSILVAYISNFVGIVLMMLNRLYTWLYHGKETANRNRRYASKHGSRTASAKGGSKTDDSGNTDRPDRRL